VDHHPHGVQTVETKPPARHQPGERSWSPHYTGSHTLAISGIAPGGGQRVLTLGVTVAAVLTAAAGLAFVLLGALMVIVLREPRRRLQV